MCLLVAAFDRHPDYRLVLVGHRDEFHARPAAALGWWQQPPGLLAGRDLQAGGTWLGVSREGRVGVVTNFRAPGSLRPDGPSRGELVPAFLAGDRPASEFGADIVRQGGRYSGFNLLLLDDAGLFYVTNHPAPEARSLSSGLYGLSNDRLDVPWPKVLRARERVAELLDSGRWTTDALFRALRDRVPAPDGSLPDTGIGVALERLVSAPFIVDAQYGTRCATVVLVRRDGVIRVDERRFDPQGETTGRSAFAFRSAATGHERR